MPMPAPAAKAWKPPRVTSAEPPAAGPASAAARTRTPVPARTWRRVRGPPMACLLVYYVGRYIDARYIGPGGFLVKRFRQSNPRGHGARFVRVRLPEPLDK